MHPVEIQPAEGADVAVFGGCFDAPPPLGPRLLPPSHFSRVRVNVGSARVFKGRVWKVGGGSGVRSRALPPPLTAPVRMGAAGPRRLSQRVLLFTRGWYFPSPVGRRLRWTACSAPEPRAVAGGETSQSRAQDVGDHMASSDPS